MSQLEEAPESYELDDRCIVPWRDGSIYAGKIQKILDPERQVVIQGVPTRKNGKTSMIEDTTPFEKLKNDRNQRIPLSVIEASLETNEKWYYVHYFGWKTNYDEWLPLQRMLPHTPRNINEMKRINQEIKDREKQKRDEEARQKKNRKRIGSPVVESVAAAESPQVNAQPRAAKRQHINEDSTTKESSPAHTPHSSQRRRAGVIDGSAYELRLSVPLELKRLLVKDWQLVTRDREIVKLPRPICVVEILKDFANPQAPSGDSGDHENMAHFIDSMTTYFDYAFGNMLLYRFERNQYYAQRHNNPNFKPSLVYGAEHLARLIVSMPTLLSQLTAMDDITMQYIMKQLENLSKYLSDHRVRYFAGEKSYDSATRIYEMYSVPHLAPSSATPPEISETNSKEEDNVKDDVNI